MNYTANELVIIMGAIGLLAPVVTAGIVAIITASLKRQVAEVASDAKVIVGHVNSKATASDAKIDALQNEIKFLRSEMSNNRQVAAVLAQSAAPIASAVPHVDASVVNPESK